MRSEFLKSVAKTQFEINDRMTRILKWKLTNRFSALWCENMLKQLKYMNVQAKYTEPQKKRYKVVYCIIL